MAASLKHLNDLIDSQYSASHIDSIIKDSTMTMEEVF